LLDLVKATSVESAFLKRLMEAKERDFFSVVSETDPLMLLFWALIAEQKSRNNSAEAACFNMAGYWFDPVMTCLVATIRSYTL
jgi:hypothetical protein